jgi:hypothetical protein
MEMTPEGPAAWIGSVGAWAGAVATFVTAVVALWIALNSNRQERQRRREEAEARRQAAVRSLLHAHRLMAMVYEGNEAKPQANLATKGLRAVTESALAALGYALSQPFANAKLLEHALNLQTTLTMIARDIADIPPGAAFYTVADVAKMLEPFEADMAKGKAALEAMI